jgi:hypothetical protein
VALLAVRVVVLPDRLPPLKTVVDGNDGCRPCPTLVRVAIIRDPTKSRFTRLSHALYLLGFTRNQVAHRMDKSSKLFNQLADAKDLVDLFLTLCRTDEWKGL